jgi:hypothetical protein
MAARDDITEYGRDRPFSPADEPTGLLTFRESRAENLPGSKRYRRGAWGGVNRGGNCIARHQRRDRRLK